MNGFLIQIKNKTNKIIKLNNEIAHERIPNTNQKLSPPAGRPAFFPFFVVHKVSRMFSPKPPGRPAGPAQTSPDRPRPAHTGPETDNHTKNPRPAQTSPDRPRPAQTCPDRPRNPQPPQKPKTEIIVPSTSYPVDPANVLLAHLSRSAHL